MGKAKLLSLIMHCKTNNNTYNQVFVKKERPSTEDVQNATIKKEKTERICRACLKEGDIPIFGSDSSEDVSGAFSMFAGVSISSDDPYTKFLCKSCNMHLASAILFRNTAQHSELLLKSTVKDIDHSQKTVKVKKTFSKSSKSIGKGRIANEKNKDVNSLQSLIMDAASIIENSTKVKKKDMPHCRTCNSSFNSIDALIEHKKIEKHENNKEECPICHKMYASVYLKTHMSVHGSSRSICEICGKSFRFPVSFHHHKATHTNKFPHKCTLCPYKTRSSESLNKHMRTHTGEKPYQCTECSSAFTTKSNLIAHEKRNHRNREFPCELCNKAFCFKRDLEIHHKVTHLGIKEHQCDICCKEFGSRSKMMKHTLKVHKRAKLANGRKPLYLQIESTKQQECNISKET